jgi:hypothetical protein
MTRSSMRSPIKLVSDNNERNGGIESDDSDRVSKISISSYGADTKPVFKLVESTSTAMALGFHAGGSRTTSGSQPPGTAHRLETPPYLSVADLPLPAAAAGSRTNSTGDFVHRRTPATTPSEWEFVTSEGRRIAPTTARLEPLIMRGVANPPSASKLPVSARGRYASQPNAASRSTSSSTKS